ncbi:MAG: glycosyl transferase [Proteobacteria bacterium]|nr:glycosyl transferase [Pseudomonadota bacterium]MBS0572103.1 glycosyl transferase [Pseudomonadota bacterium]
MSRAPRLFFYVQHLLGIGHLARASRIASALAADGFEVTVVTGGTPVPGFPGPGVRHVALPPVVAGDAGFSGLRDAEGRPVDAAFETRRRDLLLTAFRDLAPDLVMIEAFPFGRRQVRFELIPLLQEIQSRHPRPRVACSLRDILQERAKPGRDEESVALVRQYFDLVLVHGDPAFVRLEETFPLAARIGDRIAYTGLVAPPPPAPVADRFEVVASAGGGAVGAALIGACAEAARRLPDSGRWCLVTGPNLPDADFAAISGAAPPNASVVRFRPDFPGLIANARLSVSQAGYNTVCDVLRAGCRCLLVPFATGGETEQTLRADRLHRLGLAGVLTEADLSADSLTAAVAQALAAGPPPPFAPDLDGAAASARILRTLLERTP